MVERRRVAVFIGVLLGHAGLVLWLSRAMAPLPLLQDQPSMLMVELLQSPPPQEPAPAQVEPEPVAETPPPVRARTRRWAPVTEAVIESPSPQASAEADAPREFVAPERDPFSTPPPATTGFGRRDVPQWPTRSPPRIAGEAPPDAPLQGLRTRRRGAREVVEFVGALIGGGPNAPVEVRCGGRMNGAGVTMAESFSPAWQQHYGCSDTDTGAGYDGRVELPDTIAR